MKLTSNLRSPIGGFAYGIPSNFKKGFEFTVSPTYPSINPNGVFTVGTFSEPINSTKCFILG